MITDRSSLSDCEQVIGNAIRSLLEAGRALNLIRDKKLWSDAGYNSFDHYCQERWAFLGARGLRLINSYKQLEVIIEFGVITEEQAKGVSQSSLQPLDKLNANQRKAIPKLYEKAVKNNKGEIPTRKQVDEVVKEFKEEALQDRLEKGQKGWVKVKTPYITIEEYDKWSKNFENLEESQYLYKLIKEDIKRKKVKH